MVQNYEILVLLAVFGIQAESKKLTFQTSEITTLRFKISGDLKVKVVNNSYHRL
jgi:hypothetical protein